MEEAEYCDRVAMIYRGHRIAQGSPRELKNRLAGEIILDLRCSTPQDLMDDLAGVRGMKEVALFGAGLHLTVDDADAVMARIRKFGKRLNVDDMNLAAIIPTMEDVFVSLIKREDRNHATT